LVAKHSDAERKAASTKSKLRSVEPTKQEGWDLGHYIEVALHLGEITESCATQTRLAKDFRNLIHPGRQSRMSQKCDRATALSARRLFTTLSASPLHAALIWMREKVELKVCCRSGTQWARAMAMRLVSNSTLAENRISHLARVATLEAADPVSSARPREAKPDRP